MTSSSYNQKLKLSILNAVGKNLSKATPSLQMQVVYKGHKIADLKVGKSYKYYDYASLTKIIFAVSAVMQAVDSQKIRINDSVLKYVSWWPHKKVTIKQLLSHSAGLPWWMPFYKSLDVKATPQFRRQQLKEILKHVKLNSSKKSIYSDLDFILLGFVLEKVYNKPLSKIWQNLKISKQLKSVHFNEIFERRGGKNGGGTKVETKYKKSLYAPTEKSQWRKKVLQGEVDDENTASFGGVSTHAGLFGDINDLTKYGLLLRSTLKSKSILTKKNIARKFTKRAVPAAKGDWALGFMMPTKGHASCGKYFDPASIGHTGFTGTSLWYDPKRDLLVTILTNRVHPTAKNNKFVKLRPKLHDLAVQCLNKSL